MKLIVKNRAGAKVLPDGLEVKDVRFEIGPTTLQFEIHVTGYVTPSLRRHKRPVGCDSQGTESRDAPVEAKAVSQSAAVGIDLDRRALALRSVFARPLSLTRDALCSFARSPGGLFRPMRAADPRAAPRWFSRTVRVFRRPVFGTGRR